MTEIEKATIRELRTRGLGMQAIADIMKMGRDNVRYFLRKEGLGGARGGDVVGRFCLECGRPVKRVDGKRLKRFCTDRCRIRWWNRRRRSRRSSSMEELVCPVCGQMFWAYGSSHRRFCSCECYRQWRIGRNGRKTD